MDSPPRDESSDAEALARIVLQCRELLAHVTDLNPTLPKRNETPFLYRQLDEVSKVLVDTLRHLGTGRAQKDVKKPEPGGARNLFRKLKQSFARQREPQIPTEPQPRVDLQGNAWTIPTPEVLGFLSNSRKTGVLWVNTFDENFMIEIRKGDLVFATSDRTPEGMRLGEVLVEMELLKADEVEELVLKAAEAETPLGAYVLEEGLVEEGDLRDALGHQVQGLFGRLTRAENAIYRFQEGIELAEAKDLNINITHLLIESARRHDEERHHGAQNDDESEKAA